MDPHAETDLEETHQSWFDHLDHSPVFEITVPQPRIEEWLMKLGHEILQEFTKRVQKISFNNSSQT